LRLQTQTVNSGPADPVTERISFETICLALNPRSTGRKVAGREATLMLLRAQ
jgi:hypothetical protein